MSVRSGELLVASAGGHLEQLMRLRDRLDPGTAGTWVTYDVAQARSSLPDEPRIFAHHPTTKNIPNAVRNYRLARRVFATMDVGRVVSTGAAVAVPFMLRASRLGIPCHYIESATRVDGPSLSGRMLQHVNGVHLYRQLGEWGEPRWRQGPCVFDGFRTAAAKARGVERVVVSFGTHGYAYPALVERLAACFRGSSVDVLWQLGSTPDPGGLPGTVVEYLPRDGLRVALAEADVVVGHAGVGLTLRALEAGRVPVLVPRRRARREHTDDHQVQLARELSRRGLAVAAEVEELSHEHLGWAAGLTVTFEDPDPFDLVG